MLSNCFDVYKNRFVSAADTSQGRAFLSELEETTPEQAQKSIDEVQKKYLAVKQDKELKAAVEKSIKQIENGKKSLRKVFKNVYFAGDSLIAGLETYNVLNSKKIFAQVSASLYHLQDNLENIVSASPRILILHYGINLLGTEQAHLDNFISFYKKLVKQLQKELPDTRIIVSLIFPVDRSVATAKRFARIPAYNKELKKMCRSLEVEYLDSSSVLKAHKECYGSDGIHQSKAFYEKYWLPFVMRQVGIY